MEIINHINESCPTVKGGYPSPIADLDPEVPDFKFSADDLLKTRTTVLNGTDPEATRLEIRRYFHQTFQLYEKLFEVLADDSVFFKQPDKLRHPLIFYWGHTAVFYINKLCIASLTTRIDAQLEGTCAIGVDEMSWDDLNSGHYDWPTVDRVRKYRDLVAARVDNLIMTSNIQLPITWDSPFWIIMMGIEHERIHLETSSVLFRQLDIKDVKLHDLWERCQQFRDDPDTVPDNELLDVPGATVTLGRTDRDQPRVYGWDNEFAEEAVVHEVVPFKASKFLVSNKEWLEFSLDGGYLKEEYWTPEGWKFRNFLVDSKKAHPLFWIPADPDHNCLNIESLKNPNLQFRYRTMLEEIDMPWDWPVDLNYLEAKAFCNWKADKTGRSIRLPTEAEYEALRNHCITGDEADSCKWTTAPGNINLEDCASSTPIDKYETRGFYDVVGNVWQHTETPMAPYPGFAVHRFYDDFTVPTFDNKHNIIAGGSWISTGNEATKEARYAFRRHFYQHAGLRYIDSEVKVDPLDDLITFSNNESDVAQYAHHHWGDANDLGVANHPKAVAQACVRVFKTVNENKSKSDADCGNETKSDGDKVRALELGCSAGRAVFEMATHFDEVIGLDLTTRVLRVPLHLRDSGSIQYEIVSEGELCKFKTVTLSDAQFNLDEVRAKVDFLQQDACNWDALKYGCFDLVLCSRILCELYNPECFLTSVHDRIKIGGLLVLVTSYNWNQKYTPKDKWLGGYRNADTGECISSATRIAECLSTHFKQVGTPEDIPCVLRLSDRIFTHENTEMTVWQRLK